MSTWKDVVAIVKTLPGAEVATWYGTTGLKVGGKGFGRLRTEAEGGLVLMCTLDEKERLLESGEPAYYTTPHYDGHGSIIVNLSLVTRDALRDLVMQSYRLTARQRPKAGGEDAVFQSPRTPSARRRKRSSTN